MTEHGRGGLRTVVLLAALTALSVTPARAQSYDNSIAWGGGYIKFAPFVKSGNSTPSDIGFDGTWVAVAQGETWQLNRRIGFRLGGSYSHGSLNIPSGSRRAGTFGLETAALLRIVAPRAERSVSAYLIGGGGLVWFSVEDEGEDVIPLSGTNVIYESGETRQFAGLAGLGIEMTPKWNFADSSFGLRVEAIDHVIFGSPFRPADSNASEPSHNPRFTVTIFSVIDF